MSELTCDVRGFREFHVGLMVSLSDEASLLLQICLLLVDTNITLIVIVLLKEQEVASKQNSMPIMATVCILADLALRGRTS